MASGASLADPRALLSLTLLVLGTALAYWAVWHPRWEVPAAALAGSGIAAWSLSNLPYEGAVLVVPVDGNGLTAADLLSAPGLVLVVYLCQRAVRR